MVFALNDDPMQIDKTWLKPLIEQEKQCWHVNNLSCLSKPHYPITKIQKKLIYNYCATILWVLQLLCKYPPKNTMY
jgi:hypothetical protein